MLKTLFLRNLKRFKHDTEVIRYLEKYPEKALLLGFKQDGNRVKLPRYKNFWHFVNIRLGKKGLDTIFQLLRDDCVKEAKRHGISIAEKVIEDATPIPAHKKDKSASYSGHYKIRGYKLDTITSLDYEIPLAKHVMSIKEDEAKCFISQQTKILKAGIRINAIWVDCGYTDYPNLAWAGVNRITVHHKIASNWKYNKKAEEKAIKRMYQKHWKEEDFVVNA